MSIPKSVIRINKSGVQYISSCDRAAYTIQELSRAALRDVGKFITRRVNDKLLKLAGGGLAKTGRIIKTKGSSKTSSKDMDCGYWVRKKEGNMQVGIKHDTWYGTEQELGSSKMKKLGLLKNTVNENIAEIIKIESQYLSALESEAKALEKISEEEYEGSGEE